MGISHARFGVLPSGEFEKILAMQSRVASARQNGSQGVSVPNLQYSENLACYTVDFTCYTVESMARSHLIRWVLAARLLRPCSRPRGRAFGAPCVLRGRRPSPIVAFEGEAAR